MNHGDFLFDSAAVDAAMLLIVGQDRLGGNDSASRFKQRRPPSRLPRPVPLTPRESVKGISLSNYADDARGILRFLSLLFCLIWEEGTEGCSPGLMRVVTQAPVMPRASYRGVVGAWV